MTPIKPGRHPALGQGRLPGIPGPSPFDEWVTPAWIFEAMRERFDLDPCAATGGDFVPVETRWTAAEDGLARDWFGFVWCNPPYSRPQPWVERMIAHGSGILLGPFANSPWIVDATARADTFWISREGKLAFLVQGEPRRIRWRVTAWGFGARASAALERLAVVDGLTRVFAERAGEER